MAAAVGALLRDAVRGGRSAGPGAGLGAGHGAGSGAGPQAAGCGAAGCGAWLISVLPARRHRLARIRARPFRRGPDAGRTAVADRLPGLRGCHVSGRVADCQHRVTRLGIRAIVTGVVPGTRPGRSGGLRGLPGGRRNRRGPARQNRRQSPLARTGRPGRRDRGSRRRTGPAGIPAAAVRGPGDSPAPGPFRLRRPQRARPRKLRSGLADRFPAARPAVRQAGTAALRGPAQRFGAGRSHCGLAHPRQQGRAGSRRRRSRPPHGHAGGSSAGLHRRRPGCACGRAYRPGAGSSAGHRFPPLASSARRAPRFAIADDGRYPSEASMRTGMPAPPSVAR